VNESVRRVLERTARMRAEGRLPKPRDKERRDKPAPKAARQSLPCVHLGEPTGETRPCQGCGGRVVQVPLRTCAVYGVCSESRVVKLAGGGPVRCCRAMCPGYEAAV
jgi:hypothetical protein